MRGNGKANRGDTFRSVGLPDISDAVEDLHRVLVKSMSLRIFGMKYEDLSVLIYPEPKYVNFSIPKKTGGVRQISAPVKKVKALQLALLDYMRAYLGSIKDPAHGFVNGRSILTNARMHCSEKTTFILNLDIKDFFPSITFYRVRGLFQSHPFNFSQEVATVLSHLCCYKGGLVQGSPTSPIISNLICRTLDRDLEYISKRHRVIYTRYCDDMTFSFYGRSAEQLPKAFCTFDGENVVVGDDLENAIVRNGFALNVKKTRISSKFRRMEVTGLKINKFPNVRRSFIDKIRGLLHAWETFGYEDTSKEWSVRDYKRGLRSGNSPEFYAVLRGQLLYLKMIRGENDFIYGRLAGRFNNLLFEANAQGFAVSCIPLPVLNSVNEIDHVSSAVFVISSRFGIDEIGLPLSQVDGTIFSLSGGLLLTCEHCVSDPEPKSDDANEASRVASYFVVNPDNGDEFELELLDKDFHRDIAVLRFKKDKPKGIREFSFSGNNVASLNKVSLHGFPNWTNGRPVSHMYGDVISVFTKSAVSCCEVGISIRQGNSGGPLLNDRFEVVGMATQGATVDKGNNECVNMSELKGFVTSLPSKKESL